MKIKYIQTLLILSFSLSLCAQEEVSSTTMMIDDSSVPYMRIEVALPVDESRDYFEEFMKEKYDIKVNGNGLFSGNKRMTIEQESMSSISENEMDMFIDFEEIGNNHSVVTIAARNGYDLYFSKEYAPVSNERVKGLIISYEEYALDEHYKNRLEEQQSRLDKAMKIQERMENKISDNEKDIAKNLNENENLKKANEVLKEDLDAARKNLSEVRSAVKVTESRLDE